MERQEKSSIKAQIQVEDGKIAALQADPECRELNRMVADVNKRVIRVQTHGLASWEKDKAKSRGFGVEVAREAVEEEEPGASETTHFYSAAEEPAQREGATVVEQYLQAVQEAEGQPGPIRRTLRGWVYGQPAPKAPGDSCCCRQVEAVAGKMTIAQATDMKDEAVDRLLVDVYFHPPPKQGICRRVLRRTKKFCERMKSVFRRSRAVSRVGKAGSTKEAGAQVESLQLRQSRHASSARGSATGVSHPEASQQEGGPEHEQAERASEAAPRETRASSEEERFYSVQGSPASSEERAGSTAQQTKLQTDHNVGVYQLILLDEESNSNRLQPEQISFTPHARNRKPNAGLEILQEETGLSENVALQEQNELSECGHHKTVMEDDQEVEEFLITVEETEQNTSPNGRVHFEGEQPEECREGSGQMVDVRPSDRRDSEGSGRHVVGSLELYILNDSSEFDWEPVPDISEELTLGSEHMGGLEFEEDSQRNNEEGESSSTHPRMENTFPDERPLPDSDDSGNHDTNRAPVPVSRAEEEQEVSIQLDLPEENIQNAENDSRPVRADKWDRRTI